MRGWDEGAPFSPSMPLAQLTFLPPLLWAPAVTACISDSRPPHHCQINLLQQLPTACTERPPL